MEPQAIDLILFHFRFVFKVKVLYARNLLLSTSEETIEQVFSKFGEVERVKKIKDYSFIHFRTKEQARAALEAMNGNKTFMFMFCESITFPTGTGRVCWSLSMHSPWSVNVNPLPFCVPESIVFYFPLLGLMANFTLDLPTFVSRVLWKNFPGDRFVKRLPVFCFEQAVISQSLPVTFLRKKTCSRVSYWDFKCQTETSHLSVSSLKFFFLSSRVFFLHNSYRSDLKSNPLESSVPVFIFLRHLIQMLFLTGGPKFRSFRAVLPLRRKV